MIDRRRVRHSFHRQALEYDAHAAVQKRVVERFLQILDDEVGSPLRILDVGAGTGLLARQLADCHPAALLSCVDLAPGMAATARQRLGSRALVAVADAEHLPFAGASFDCVVSTSTFQWLTTLDAAFGEVWRVLAPGGLFAFALFGHGTFHELKDSYRSALTAVGREDEDRTQRFFTEAEAGAALERTGFGVRRLCVEDEVEWHPDVPAFLRSVKRVGAGNASPLRGRGLAERRVMVEMMRVYGERYGGERGIPATYTVIYGVGVKSGRK
ncbi:Methyltransferase type 11 [Geobacter metallireducens RCH3]|uniref:Malonyl-[acyl-carrier protein] O-methyltransferase n=1 Tax=Geobacter metallireducens (strain ATCC 53774 / DSM 7210 / GS-15) TaxID=269799 RepID=Q39XD8_GEOMG|nr:methyltransferase domain-containing protein [Geobacter metallireducens]ABB31086.1 malonyl-CoA O-methyltransferase [Geobacter metallireducens GS-15]EHP86865.1 Methyltransferase type 11 [Geobacter metallireducens RCH3]